jgi:hypothetical protein
MSFNINQQPLQVSFGKNTMPLVLRSNTYRINEPTAFSGTLTLKEQPTDGKTIGFNFMRLEKTLIYTFRTNAQGVLDLPIGDIFSQAYIVSLIKKLNNHYIFDKYYNLTTSSLGRRIILTAKEPGSIANMGAFPPTNSIVADFQTTSNGIDTRFLPNFTFHVDLYIEEVFKSGKFTAIESMVGTPDEKGNAAFNLAPRLETFLQPRMVQPTTIKRLENQNNKRYYFVVAEAHGISAEPSLIRKGTIRNILRAGIDDFGHKRFNHRDAKSFFKGKWITHWPTQREITEEQPQYLSLLYPGTPAAIKKVSAGDGLKIYAQVKYKDGTQSNEFILHDAQEALQDEIFTFSTGILNNPQLRQLNNQKEIDSYSIEARYFSRELSVNIAPKINFKVVSSHYQDLFLIYENSLGAWETIRVSGARKSKVEVKKEEYNRIQDITNTDRKTIFHQMESYSEPLAVTTGPIDPDVHKLMLELFTSEDIVLVTPKGYLPVEISSDKYDFENTAENVKSHEFVIRRSQFERNYPVEDIAAKEVEEMDEKIETIGQDVIKRP